MRVMAWFLPCWLLVAASSLASSLPPLVASGESFGEVESLLASVSRQILVDTVAFSPDGTILATGSNDRKVRLWDVASRNEIRCLEGHEDFVLAVAFSPDSKFLASASFEGGVRLWSLTGSGKSRSLEGHSRRVVSLAFSPDSSLLASASYDGSVRLWDVTNGSESQRFADHSGNLLSVAFSPDGSLLSITSSDGTVWLRDARRGDELHRFEGSEGRVLTSAFGAENEALVATASEDGTVRVWDVANAVELRRLEGHGRRARAAAFSSDGGTFAASGDGSVRFWNALSGDEIRRLDGRLEGVRDLAFGPEGTRLVSVTGEGAVQIWDVASGSEIGSLQGRASQALSVVFGSTGETLASISDDGGVQMWNVATGAEVRRLSTGDQARSISLSADGRAAVVAEGDAIRLLDLASGEVVQHLPVQAPVRVTALSHTGKILAAATADGSVWLWDRASGRGRYFKDRFLQLSSMAFSPEGKTLALAAEDGTVRLWDVADGKESRKLVGHHIAIRSLAFDASGKILASASADGTARLWDTASGVELRRLDGHRDTVLAVAFEPQGEILASASADSTVRLWNVSDGTEIERLEGHTGWVHAVAFSSDGKLLVSSGGEIRLWRKEDRFIGSRISLIGRRGTWASCEIATGECLRHDDGTLLLQHREDGRLEPIPPKAVDVSQALELVSAPTLLTTGDGVSTAFNVRVRNAGTQRAFWVGLRRSDLTQGESFGLALPAPRAILEPGEEVDLSCRVSVASTYESPRDRVAALALEVVSLAADPLAIPSITVHSRAPTFELQSARWSSADEAPILQVALRYHGDGTQSAARVSAVIDGLEAPIPVLERSIHPGEEVLATFSTPEGFRPNQATAVTVTVRSRHPAHVWTFQTRPTFPTPFLPVVLALGVALAAGYIWLPGLHPLVQEPTKLYEIPPQELRRARLFLTLTRRLDSVLERAGVDRARLAEAISITADPNPASRVRRIASRLGFKARQRDLGSWIWDFELGTGFPLNLSSCLLYLAPEELSADDALLWLRDHDEARDQITLVMSADPARQDAMYQRCAGPDLLLVAPSSTQLTALLLTPEPVTLARVIASQVRRTRLSPYQTRGGINNPALFFGRDDLLESILNRAPSNHVLVGARQIGKSSLLKAIDRHYRNDKEVQCDYLVLADGDLLGKLATALGLPRSAPVGSVLTRLASTGEPGGRRLLLIDEADIFLREGRDVRSTLKHLRSLSEEGCCHFIFAGYWDLYEAAVLDYHSALRNFGELHRVGALEYDACIELATRPMDTMGLEYSNEEAAGLMVQAAGRRANLVSLACNEILRRLAPLERKISDEVVDQALRSLAVNEALEGWRRLGIRDGENGRLERILVYATIQKGRFSKVEAIRWIGDLGLAVSVGEVERALRRLELAYVLELDGASYAFCVPLFVQRVLSEQPEGMLAEELKEVRRASSRGPIGWVAQETRKASHA